MLINLVSTVMSAFHLRFNLIKDSMVSSHLVRISLVAIFLLLAGISIDAQNPIAWSIDSGALNGMKAGQKHNVKLVADIQSGWHLYSITQEPGGPVPTRITVVEGQ